MSMTSMDDIYPLYEAIQQHLLHYNAGDTDYSVTTLLNPPRVVHLNKRHADQVPQFVSNQIHSFTGTAVHEYIEKMLGLRFPNGDVFKMEERLRINILGRKISGAYDFLLMNKKILYDLKTTSTWKAVFGDKSEWRDQQNMYRFMYWKKYGVSIDSLRIFTIYRDWSLAQMYRSGPKYPKQRCVEYRLPVLEFDVIEKYMHDRVGIMIDTEDTADDDLPECTFDDMWCDPDTVAVKSTRLQRAVRVLSCMEAAENFVEKYLEGDKCKDKENMLSFEVRPSVRKRCEDWCPANGYCNQYQRYLKRLADANKGG